MIGLGTVREDGHVIRGERAGGEAIVIYQELQIAFYCPAYALQRPEIPVDEERIKADAVRAQFFPVFRFRDAVYLGKYADPDGKAGKPTLLAQSPLLEGNLFLTISRRKGRETVTESTPIPVSQPSRRLIFFCPEPVNSRLLRQAALRR